MPPCAKRVTKPLKYRVLLSGSASDTVTFLPRISSMSTLPRALSRSSWNSLMRLSSSRACMVWNSSTSSPRGVAISIALAMSASGIGRDQAGARSPHAVIHLARAGVDRTDPAHDQTAHGKAGFHSQLGSHDLRLEARVAQHPLHIRAGVRVASVGAEGDVLSSRLVRVLDGEDQHPTGPQRVRRRANG